MRSLMRRSRHRESVEVGQHDVEHDDVGTLVLVARDRLAPGGRDIDEPALVSEREPDQIGEHLLVVDEQHADGGAVGAVHARQLREHRAASLERVGLLIEIRN
jgi:hypothetical protein